MNDSMDEILNDCTAEPGAYLASRGRAYAGLDASERIERMCRDLVGRTVAVSGRNRRTFYSPASGTLFSMGDMVGYRNMPGTGKVIGSAWGDDGRRCLVVANRHPKRETWLVPIDEAEKMVIPTRGDCLEYIERRLVDAMGSTVIDAKSESERIVDMVEHFMDGKPLKA